MKNKMGRTRYPMLEGGYKVDGISVVVSKITYKGGADETLAP